MKVKQARISVNWLFHLLSVLIVAGALLFAFTNAAKADALFSVIGYHIVPLQIESTHKQQEHEGGYHKILYADSLDHIQNHDSRLQPVSHVEYLNQGEQSIEM